MENGKMSEGVAWNQGELSEETRAMLLHQKAIMGLMDEILAVSTNPHASLIRRLKTLKNQLSLEEPMPLHDVTTLDMAIKALSAHS
jgi:hypothetical protein